jgi:hypothetical protein
MEQIEVMLRWAAYALPLLDASVLHPCKKFAHGAGSCSSREFRVTRAKCARTHRRPLAPLPMTECSVSSLRAKSSPSRLLTLRAPSNYSLMAIG